MPIEPIYQKSTIRGTSFSATLKVGNRFDSGTLYLENFGTNPSKDVTPHFVADGIHHQQVATSSSPVSSTFKGSAWLDNLFDICIQLGINNLSELDPSKEDVTLIVVSNGENGKRSKRWQIDGVNFSDGGGWEMSVQDTNVMMSFGGSGQVSISYL